LLASLTARSRWCVPCRSTCPSAITRPSTSCKRSYAKIQKDGPNPFIEQAGCLDEADIQEAMFHAIQAGEQKAPVAIRTFTKRRAESATWRFYTISAEGQPGSDTWQIWPMNNRRRRPQWPAAMNLERNLTVWGVAAVEARELSAAAN